jgi:hypothetical protein
VTSAAQRQRHNRHRKDRQHREHHENRHHVPSVRSCGRRLAGAEDTLDVSAAKLVA